MSCGTPVIATDWSGPTAFLTAQNGYPLRVRAMQELEAGPWRGHQWAAPDEGHLRQLLREVHTDNQQTRDEGADSGSGSSGGGNDGTASEAPYSLASRGVQARADMLARFSVPSFAASLREQLLRVERAAAVLARAEEEAEEEAEAEAEVEMEAAIGAGAEL